MKTPFKNYFQPWVWVLAFVMVIVGIVIVFAAF